MIFTPNNAVANFRVAYLDDFLNSAATLSESSPVCALPRGMDREVDVSAFVRVLDISSQKTATVSGVTEIQGVALLHYSVTVTRISDVIFDGIDRRFGRNRSQDHGMLKD